MYYAEDWNQYYRSKRLELIFHQTPKRVLDFFDNLTVLGLELRRDHLFMMVEKDGKTWDLGPCENTHFRLFLRQDPDANTRHFLDAECGFEDKEYRILYQVFHEFNHKQYIPELLNQRKLSLLNQELVEIIDEGSYETFVFKNKRKLRVLKTYADII